jgi:hypothetical protein
MRTLFLGRDSAPEGGDHCRVTAEPGHGFFACLRARLRRRLGVTLMPMMLASPGTPMTVDVPAAHFVTNAADGDCLALAPGSQAGAVAFSPAGRSAGGCATTSLPLVQQTTLASGTLSSDLEFSNMDLGQLTAQEVAVKFGFGRDLPILGVHASIDGSFGRVLGNLMPVLDEQVHAAFTRPVAPHWDSGLEARIALLGEVGPMQPSEASGLLFLRGRYKLFSNQWEEQTLELKLSADSWQSTAQTPSRHARADLRYEYHRDTNVLSVGLNAMDTEQSVGPVGPSVGVDIRVSRQF